MPEVIVPIFVLILFVLVMYQILFKKGFRGSMRGMKDSIHIGEVGTKKWFVKTKFRVHKLLPKEENAAHVVGVEMVMTALLAFHITPMRLSAEQARELGGILLEAAEESEKAFTGED